MINKRKYVLVLVFFLFVSVGLLVSGCSQQNPTDLNPDPVQEEMVQTQDERTADDPVAEQSRQATSINQLISSGDSVHCTYEAEMDGQMIEQDVYISDNRYRVEVEVALGGQQLESTVVYDGEWIYSWNSQTEEGIKFSKEFMEEHDESQDQMAVDMTEAYAYECDVWSPSSDAFTVPGDIEFIDFDEFMRDMESMMDDGSGMTVPTQ